MCVNILLVEDSPSDAAILIAAFESIGYSGNIHVCPTGLDAIARLETQTTAEVPSYPTLILLELNLPGKNGHEILQEIKSHDTWKSIPVLIFSSSLSPADIATSYKLHANGYLAKPRELTKYERVARKIQSFWLEAVELPTYTTS